MNLPLQENLKYTLKQIPEFGERDLLSMEKEMLGIYISGHPLDSYREVIEKQATINTKDMIKIEEEHKISEDGRQIKYAGIITSVKKKFTRTGNLMAFISVEDLYGSREVVVFDSVYRKAADNLREDSIVIIEGRLSVREDDDTKIVANNIRGLDNTVRTPVGNVALVVPPSKKPPAQITLDITNTTEETKVKLRELIVFYAKDKEKNNINIQVLDKGAFKPCGKIQLNEEAKNKFTELLREWKYPNKLAC